VSVPGVVIDIFYERASVRLTSNGAVFRNLDVVGGPVQIGQNVRVDFTTAKPTIVATGAGGLSLDDLKKLLASMDFGQQNETQITITLFSGGAVKAMYPPNETGFGQCLTEANPGDAIFLPDIDITGDYVLPAGVCISGLNKGQTIIRGHLDVGANGILMNVSSIQESGTGLVYGVKLASESTVDSCLIYVFNSSGSAIGVYGDGVIQCYANDNDVYAYTTEGHGYPYFSDRAMMYVTGGKCEGATAPCGGSGSI
jgi:hypothetical protein